MKIDGGLSYSLENRASVADGARLAASVGYDRLFAAEASHDPFLPLAMAAGAADVDLGTYVAIAFARTPMTVAGVANDLQLLTEGRFILGLGSQIKAHVTRRFSMPWSHPAERMREFVLALHAIWDSWHHGTRLNFQGTFYQHTLSNPLFDPGPNRFGAPRIFLAAVGPRMTEVAGEVTDGVLCHGFTSPSYLAEVTLPALRRGIDLAGRHPDDVEVCLPVFLATGPPGSDLEKQVAALRKQISFYASTPAYRGVLNHHGWGDLQDEMHRLSMEQRWDDMAGLVDDEVLHTLGVVADADDPEMWASVIAQLKEPIKCR